MNRKILTISDFPTGIPAKALRKLDRDGFDETWLPTTMEQDLKTGQAVAVVWWFPHYVDELYRVAHQGGNFLSYLGIKYNYGCRVFLIRYFGDEVEKMYKAYKNYKKNHLDEIVVKNGKVKSMRITIPELITLICVISLLGFSAGQESCKKRVNKIQTESNNKIALALKLEK